MGRSDMPAAGVLGASCTINGSAQQESEGGLQQSVLAQAFY